MEGKSSFLGTGWAFPVTFVKEKKGILMCTDEEDIQQSLEILLTTRVGERVMNHKYGCNMDRLLFEPMNTTLQTYMEDLVRTAILYFEPRIILNAVVLDPQTEEGLIQINIDFTIRGTNSRYNFVYPYYKEEGVKTTP